MKMKLRVSCELAVMNKLNIE